jgi:hypothetical protein
MKKNVLPLIYTSVVVAIGLVLIANKQSKVSGMNDAAPALENLKRGIANGWYTAELTMVNGQQAIRLSGKLTNGKQYTDVYPVTTEVAQELRKMGVK